MRRSSDADPSPDFGAADTAVTKDMGNDFSKDLPSQQQHNSLFGALMQPGVTAAWPTPTPTMEAVSGTSTLQSDKRPSVAAASAPTKPTRLERGLDAASGSHDPGKALSTDSCPPQNPGPQPLELSGSLKNSGSRIHAQRENMGFTGIVEEEKQETPCSVVSRAEFGQPSPILLWSPTSTMAPSISEPASDEAIILEILASIVHEVSTAVSAVDSEISFTTLSSLSPDSLHARELDRMSEVVTAENKDNNGGADAYGQARADFMNIDDTIDKDADDEIDSEDEVMLLVNPTDD